MLEDIACRSKQETARAGCRIDDGGVGLRAHDLDNGIDEDARREILAGAGFGILGIFFEQAFIDVALDVGLERGPRLLVY